MRSLFIISLFISFVAHAGKVDSFSKELIESFDDQAIENEKVLEEPRQEMRRGPASVGPSEVVTEEKKIDKMNIRQIGPNNW